MRFIICVLIITINFYFVTLQDTTEESADVEDVTAGIEIFDPKNSYCFRFTWLGPNFDNTSSVNTTCNGLLDTKRVKGIPCRQPLVTTFDGTPPDINYLWQNFKERTICRRANGFVCAKYTYSFANKVQNSTYMCAKASAESGGALRSGCYSSQVNGHTVEACLCESVIGYKPCNNSSKYTVSILLFIASLIVGLYSQIR